MALGGHNNLSKNNQASNRDALTVYAAMDMALCDPRAGTVRPVVDTFHTQLVGGQACEGLSLVVFATDEQQHTPRLALMKGFPLPGAVCLSIPLSPMPRRRKDPIHQPEREILAAGACVNSNAENSSRERSPVASVHLGVLTPLRAVPPHMPE
eukprot:1158265-Pelagomonas_calceolata.AAC.6